MVIGIVVVCAGVLVLIAVAVKAHRRKVTARRVNAIYQAAVAGDRDQLLRWMNQGLSFDLQDRQGNTALHFAHYRGRQDAIDALVAFGADDNLRNHEGLSPVEMGQVAAIEDQLSEGARCLGAGGHWQDAERGRAIYTQLRQRKPRVYNPALVRCVLANPNRRTLLHLAIKLGIRGSEEKLAEVLHGYGTKDMAVDYLNAGSAALREAAEKWARRNNYRIHHLSGHTSVSWGRF
ncbi:ankyrin repeat domain-containing protein [Amycolatopsis anabasis]|uniref:ankyrin repeat domain-containing protein n=1 Tax=Amycolatopsis anabasis TaxID=1840409 RepID=UPI00131BDA01|nr:ankyrin repeat domain-containing protein [Amycolatopsis anabasis]